MMFLNCSPVASLLMTLLTMTSLCYVEAAAGSSRRWWGRSCCELSLTPQCRNVCRRARSREDVSPACDVHSEHTVYSCLERHEQGMRCCGSSSASSSSSSSSEQCQAVCKAVFFQDSTPTASQISAAEAHCDHRVTSCLRNYTRLSQLSRLVNSLPCCEQADTTSCRQHCRAALNNTVMAEGVIMEELSLYCGTPDLSVSLWQCFLRSSTNSARHHQYSHGGSIEVTGIDSAKLQCCSKAASRRCRDLCVRTYSTDWTETAQDFHGRCTEYEPRESSLNACLNDVDERCQLGCSGLDYCTNFNHRPTEMFRSCNKQADDSARNAVRLWQRGVISLPMLSTMEIRVNDIRNCQPRLWQAVSCVLHIKPCMSNGWTSSICRADCVAVLKDCLSSESNLTASEICDKLSPIDPNAPCISLSTYLASGVQESHQHEVQTPCNPNPCGNSQICEVVRRNCNSSANNCRTYVCKPGCPLGEVVTQLVPHNSYVRIPVSSVPSATNSGVGQCYRMCACGLHSRIHQCGEMTCIREEHCALSNGGIYEHGTKFTTNNCNRCVCFESDSVCTVRHCLSANALAVERERYTGLPCNCPADYEPVCAINGQTYPSSCIARCNGLTNSQIEAGSCVRDYCANGLCASDERCLTYPQVCLGHKFKAGECYQHKCVKLASVCSERNESVCDTRNREYHSLCQLLQRDGATFGHRGHCKGGCRTSGTVCGVDGNTYASECMAWAAGVPADYIGRCRVIGQKTKLHNHQLPTCANVTCARVDLSNNCVPLTPPGACCAICAGEIRVLVSQRLISETMLVSQKGPITIANVVDALRMQISVVECDVFAYPSFESDLVILVMPVTRSPTALQIEACMAETDKLFALLSTSSPIVSTYVSVSVFVGAEVRTSRDHLAVAALKSSQSSAAAFRCRRYSWLTIFLQMYVVALSLNHVMPNVVVHWFPT